MAEKATVFSGIDSIGDFDSLLLGKRIGLLTGAAGISKQARETIDILAERYHLTALFGPEHGVRGDIQAGGKVESYTDPKLGIPAFSVYGGDNRPTPEMLREIDILVVDLQEASVRFYTFLYSLANAMTACAEAGIPVVVTDRITPLGGVEVAGTILSPGMSSFIGNYELPTRIGLTIGEYAGYVNEYLNLGCDLTVVPLTGWKRSMYFDETDVPWVFPSPNLPIIDSTFAYVGTCIFEGTNVSEGRGTTRPFELIGAPWLDTEALTANMAKRGHAGALLRKTYFTPSFSKYKDEMCAAIQIHITDRSVCEPFRLGLLLLEEIWKLHPDKLTFLSNDLNHSKHYALDHLLGTDSFRRREHDAESLIQAHAAGIERFRQAKVKYHLYE